MVRQEDPELTSLHGHTEATATYNVKTHSENNLKISRTDLPLLKKHTEAPWRRAGWGREAVEYQSSHMATHK